MTGAEQVGTGGGSKWRIRSGWNSWRKLWAGLRNAVTAPQDTRTSTIHFHGRAFVSEFNSVTDRANKPVSGVLYPLFVPAVTEQHAAGNF